MNPDSSEPDARSEAVHYDAAAKFLMPTSPVPY